MYCPKCGTQNPDAAQICSSCSAVLPGPGAQAPNAAVKTSGLAIASLVLGILSFVTCLVTALPAIILGIVGLVKIAKSAGQLKGKGLAIAGIAVPSIAFLLALLVSPMMMAILFPALARSRQFAFRTVCANNLKQIGLSMQIYAEEHDGKYPTADRWCDLLIQHAGATHPIFRCRGAGAHSDRCNYAINKNLENFDTGSAPHDMVVLFETHPGWNQTGGPEMLTTDNHQGLGCNVLFIDNHVNFVKTKDLDKLKW